MRAKFGTGKITGKRQARSIKPMMPEIAEIASARPGRLSNLQNLYQSNNNTGVNVSKIDRPTIEDQAEQSQIPITIERSNSQNNIFHRIRIARLKEELEEA